MSDSNLLDAVADRLVTTAGAHHEATGGANQQWARWYAEHLIDDLNETLQSDMEIDELERWLADADRRYREEPQAGSWPKIYAGWLIAERQTTD